MPNRASRTKDWCKPMATVVQSNPEEMKEPPVKNLCERSGLQRKPQLHSRSQEQILHLILAKRPRRYDCPLFRGVLVITTPRTHYGSSQSYIFSQLFLKEEGSENTPPDFNTLSQPQPSIFIAFSDILTCILIIFDHFLRPDIYMAHQQLLIQNSKARRICLVRQHINSASLICAYLAIQPPLAGRDMAVCMMCFDYQQILNEDSIKSQWQLR